MAEIEKAIEEEVVTPDSEEVDIEIEGEESSINNNRKGARSGDPACRNSYANHVAD